MMEQTFQILPSSWWERFTEHPEAKPFLEKLFDLFKNKHGVALVHKSIANAFIVFCEAERPACVVLDVLILQEDTPPILLLLIKTSSSSSATDEEYRASLRYCRQLAQALNTALLTFCSDPMCVLSLVTTLLEDLGKKLDMKVAQSSQVLPFARRVMSAAKFQSIRGALETWIAYSAFCAAQKDANPGNKTDPRMITRDAKLATVQCFSSLGRVMLTMDNLENPRILLLRKTSPGGKTAFVENIDHDVNFSTDSSLLVRRSTERETHITSTTYSSLWNEMDDRYRNYILSDIDACGREYSEIIKKALETGNCKAWIVYDEEGGAGERTRNKFLHESRFVTSRTRSPVPATDKGENSTPFPPSLSPSEVIGNGNKKRKKMIWPEGMSSRELTEVKRSRQQRNSMSDASFLAVL